MFDLLILFAIYSGSGTLISLQSTVVVFFLVKLLSMYVIALPDSWELNLECMLEARAVGGSVTCSLVFFSQCYVMVVHPIRFQVF